MPRVMSCQLFSRSRPSENVRWIAATPLSAVPSAAKIAKNKATLSYPASVKIFRMLLSKDTPQQEVSSLWCSNNFTALAILYPPSILVSMAKTLRHLWTKSTPGKEPTVLLFRETFLQTINILAVMDYGDVRWVSNSINISVNQSLHCWTPTIGRVTLIIWSGRKERIDFCNKKISAKTNANTIKI